MVTTVEQLIVETYNPFFLYDETLRFGILTMLRFDLRNKI